MFWRNGPRVIDRNDISRLPLVRDGVYSRELAQDVFDLYFDQSGTQRATQLGLNP